MDLSYLISVVAVFIPLYLLVLLGPSPNKQRWIYLITGLFFASMIGMVLFLINLDDRLSPNNPDVLWARTSRVSLAGLLEELTRYPALLIALKLGKKQVDNNSTTERGWTKIVDPHGLGLYFGVGWGLAETFGFYLWPLLQDYQNGVEWEFINHIIPITYRITAVMAHTALTYLAMIITINRGFYKFTIILHMSTNIVNEVFSVLSSLDAATTLVVIFTRFSIVAIVYFFMRPRVRYITPALLFLIEVILFLFFILLGSIIYLIVNLVQAGITDVT